MSILALSPVAPEPPSPMITSVTPVTPTLDPRSSTCPTARLSQALENQSQDRASSLGPGPSHGPHLGGDPSKRSKKPPPLHTGADWKVVLHLPEIETWLRATSDRVTQLTHSAGQDGDNRHVDVHLVQLKDICEDISDHVEQIHALLETEFSLKLLSYSVNIIVDIRTVQLLWHQLRVSVLVLKERLLQGLQDSNGNYTRQTDILQAFSQDQHQTRLDALTEVDDCGQLTIRCSQDYFSLDCGITAFELSDYSPGDESEAQGAEPDDQDPPQDQELPRDQSPLPDLGSVESEGPCPSNPELCNSLPELTTPGDFINHNHSPSLLPIIQCGTPGHSEGVKRPLQGVSHSTEVSPTQPSVPKRAALYSDRRTRSEHTRGGSGKVSPLSGLQFQAELSRSTPSLMDPPDRSKFWLELDSVYPENVSQSYESLQVMNGRNLRRNHESSRHGGGFEGRMQRPLPDQRSSSVAGPNLNAPLPPLEPVSQDEISNQMERTQKETHAHSEGDSDSSLPSPMREQLLLSDLEASREESDPRPPPGKTAVWIVKRQEQKGALVSPRASPDREHWYGSEEFLALPAQLRKTEMLTMKLESLAQSIPMRPGDSDPEALQDVDDWDLTELNTDWDTGDNVSSVGESGDDNPSPLPPLLPYRRHLVCRFSPTSSSDIAPSVGESIESGPLSDLQSEEDEGRGSVEGRGSGEGRGSAERPLQLTASLMDGRGGVSLLQELLEDIQTQDKDPDVWRKIECFVQQLDGFISWLQGALDSTENWTQPRQDLDSLGVYLDTHLSFKMNVDSHSVLKESVVEEGRALLAVITSHQSGLKDILLMVSSQWDQLQRQVRRQHGWMLRALRCIQARLLHSCQSHELFTAATEPADGLKTELISSQRAALEQMAVKLSSLRYPSSTSRRHYSQMARSNSLQEFEAEYQELWDWLMDMDAMVMDSHQLMMSEEQRHHLFKSSHVELMMMESRKTSLLGRAEALKRSGLELPSNFHCKVHNLTHTWRQMEKIFSDHPGPSSSQQNQSANVHALLVGGRGGGGGAVENPRSALSPLTNSLLEQLEARIKELKAWLRDTELLIFNSCLRQDKDASEQLQSFKSLCVEVRARRRGVSSVLKLCQKLLQQSQSGPMAEVGPEAEQHREALQLLSINLERRWEAIVMQALQWQNRLKREQQVPGNFLEPGLVDLHQISPVPVGPAAPVPEDSWEWDETDMTITEIETQEEPEPDLTHNFTTEPDLPLDIALSNGNQPERIRTGVPAPQRPENLSNTVTGSSSEVQPRGTSQPAPPNNNNIYQVYSLHSVELFRQPQFPLSSSSLHKTKSGKQKQQLLLKSLSKDSSFSSIESLTDLLGGSMSNSRGGDTISGYLDGEGEREGGRGSGQSANSRRSECESGIVSDTGETETTTNSEIQEEEKEKENEEDEEDEQRKEETDLTDLCKDVTKYNQRNKTEDKKEKGWRRDENRAESRRNREEEKRRRHRRGGGEAVEILMNRRGILTPTDSDSDFEAGGLGVDSSKPFVSRSPIPGLKVDQLSSLESSPALSRRASSPLLSQGSSLESLLALGGELFPSKDPLHRSASLESCLAPCRGTEGENGGSLASLGELDLGPSREGGGGQQGEDMKTEHVQGEPSSGELSRRTLDLLKRLENIQSPLMAKMTRSVSDMTLRGSSPPRGRIPASPSFGGRPTPLYEMSSSSRRGPPSLINESSATASLTELSSTEDSSVGSEDFALLRNQRRQFLDPNMAANANSGSYRKRGPGNSRGGQSMDEADAASLSMVVNVSCASACTDEDEDDSDLLSSSTLTLTEEELGVRDGEDEEEGRLSYVSSGNEDDEEEMEGSYVLGLEYMRSELQSWIRAPRTSSKTEAGLRDELQCGTHLSSFSTSSHNKEQQVFLNRSAPKLIETSTNSGNDKKKREKKEQEDEEENRRNVTRSYISQFVDDVENGNVDQSCLKGKDEDDELLREESSVFTKKGESLRESYGFAPTGESVRDVGGSIVKTESSSTKQLSSPPARDLLPFRRASSLVGQLQGELPCHSSSLPSPLSLSPVEDCRSHDALHSSRPEAGGRKAITIQEKFKFSSFVTEETRREVRDKESSLPPKKRRGCQASCHDHRASSSSLRASSVDEGKTENVHDFVMEIIDMTSLALRSKENQPEDLSQVEVGGSSPDQGPASLTQIRDKVLEHSHRPLHLRKGDFYSYLSLSSHDSDCGEVSQCSEDKSSSPAPYSLPSYASPPPTQGLRSPSPGLFTSARRQSGSPTSLDSRNDLHALDLRSAHREANGSEPTSPSQSLPPSPDIRDEETLFAACTEEVYLGPPLCYSMVLTRKPRTPRLKENQPRNLPSSDDTYLTPGGPPSEPGGVRSHLCPSEESVLDQTQRSFLPLLEPRYTSFSTSSPSTTIPASLQGPGRQPRDDTPPSPPAVSSGAGRERQGEDWHLLCDVAGREVASVSAPQEQRSRNEAPAYLNPRARVGPIDSSAAPCLEDTKTLESNMGPVMTEISVCGSATNPSKEPGATRINPKINCPPMREADRGGEEEGGRRGGDARRVKREEKTTRGRSGSQQEARAVPAKQVSAQSTVTHSPRAAQGRSQASVRHPPSRAGPVRRLPVPGAGTSGIQL